MTDVVPFVENAAYTAAQVAEMSVGDRLALEGRVQSRNYTKMLDTGPEERTAFEVSIMQLEEP